jgi:periplasmic protein TonB
MYLHGDRSRDRLWAIAGVVAIHGLLAYALLSGLTARVSERANDTLKLIDIVVPLPQPPPPPPPPPTEASKPKGEPSPPNLKAVPTPVVAPPPKLPAPSPIVAAPIPSTGSAASAGASQVAGPGTGAGGIGSGLGDGGTGGGGNHAQRVRGQLNNSDYPIGARIAGIEGVVAVRFTIQPDGRVSGCQILKSSGNTELDGTTCRLIERRFRYRPARDTQGRPIAEVATTSFTWGIRRR